MHVMKNFIDIQDIIQRSYRAKHSHFSDNNCSGTSLGIMPMSGIAKKVVKHILLCGRAISITSFLFLKEQAFSKLENELFNSNFIHSHIRSVYSGCMKHISQILSLTWGRLRSQRLRDNLPCTLKNQYNFFFFAVNKKLQWIHREKQETVSSDIQKEFNRSHH